MLLVSWWCSLSVSVTAGEDTELQMGISTEGTTLEGEFLGAESTSCGYMLKLGTIVSRDGMRAVTKWDPKQSKCHHTGPQAESVSPHWTPGRISVTQRESEPCHEIEARMYCVRTLDLE